MNQKIKLNLIVFLVLAIMFFIYRQISNKSNQTIKDNYEVTSGRIFNYFVVGAEAAKYLEYEYFVEEQRYTRKMNVNIPKFYKCNEDIAYCQGKLFWVIYSPNKPKRSLIDFTNEIQGVENPPFPETLEDFQ